MDLINSAGQNKKQCVVTVKINNVPIDFKMDTGAAVNVISLNKFKQIGLDLNKLKCSSNELRTFTKQKIPIIGTCYIKVESMVKCKESFM